MPRVVIDGNIGSGKTTQLGLLEKKGWKVRRDPIDEWPLEEFYKLNIHRRTNVWGYRRVLDVLKYFTNINVESNNDDVGCPARLLLPVFYCCWGSVGNQRSL